MNEQTEKQCNVCGATRELIWFSKRLSCRDGYNTTCKLCLRPGGLAHQRRAERRAAAVEPSTRSPRYDGAPKCRRCEVVLGNGRDVTAEPSATHSGLCEYCAGRVKR